MAVAFDNHIHLRKDGRFLEAVKDFKKAGGTHFVLCQYPMPELVIRTNSYNVCYMETLKMAKEIRGETNVSVFVTVGPYPADYLKLKEKLGRAKAIELMKKGMDEAADLCKEGTCIGIGEIGRPHFPVDEVTIEDSNEILRYGMQKAVEVDVPVVLHTESTTPEQCKELVEMGRKVGLSSDKIVKHFAPALIKRDENFGLMPSVLASKKNIVESLKKGTRFMMETDYIDDPRGPGAVLGPKTVPRLTKKLLDDGVMTEVQAYEIHVKNPQKTYGISLEE
ncbi:MAG: TatD family hydrolase [Thermoplasmatales archaeon]|nr:MAG: TatD family hydrolase [Thermoplasmatales archaeon]